MNARSLNKHLRALPAVLPVSAVAEILECSEATVRRYARTMKVERIGTSFAFTHIDVRRLALALENGAGPGDDHEDDDDLDGGAYQEEVEEENCEEEIDDDEPEPRLFQGNPVDRDDLDDDEDQVDDEDEDGQDDDDFDD